MKKIAVFFFGLSSLLSFSQEIALLKYSGGGDWYANPTSLPNLVKFCNQNINTKLNTKIPTVEVGSPDLLSYPFVHMTGHGNVVFSDNDILNLRNYLTSGGFLHIDDNYGMDQYIRKEIKRVFPDNPLIELPASHAIFQKPFVFSTGLPKIHEHDNKKPQAFGIIVENRLVLLYTVETDLGDGWENQEVHNDPIDVRTKALKMGANILNYVFNN
ncbi:hypothetical protein FCR2A7T_21340 [Flavobacterium cauense R2A-7]|uniref:Uncharacterized protein DUF4159 n=1 Tax=Flavobacterium cauense R2A-7 TaxID=1341154 RepID=V6RW69_9FLAO|nr:DUF4159 domain-containing protein [Flavobacterium cauense]ESU18731.1 hypothetical protein FCR2A7T_21340 [Flavobacterium cauense R2A-7]KGO81794.1 hypothetical protein Q762_08085 [Flavobacterium cauense R2A-7]TWI13827.1 uncharacterized protein DUF4159 [Flavobacterium cauense R2A-7]